MSFDNKQTRMSDTDLNSVKSEPNVTNVGSYTTSGYSSWQDEDQLQNEFTSELIIKSDQEWSDVEETEDNADSEGGNDSNDTSEVKKKTSTQEKKQKSANNIKFCAHCEFATRSKRSLRKHIQAQHAKQSKSEIDDCAVKSYACQICDHIYKRKSELTKHMKLHESKVKTDKGLYECDVCKKQFKRRYRYLDHLDIHLNKNPYKCMLCDKEFKKVSSLNSHIKNIHVVVVRSFHCKECSTSYKTKFQLKNHQLRVHNDIFPFKCEKCDKSFKFKVDLSRHDKRIHNNEKQLFQCKKCNQIFQAKSNLINHAKVHIDSRLFDCVHCGRKFKTKGDLSQHSIVHSDARRRLADISEATKKRQKTPNIYKYCAHCDFSTSCKRSLRNHIIERHIKSESKIGHQVDKVHLKNKKISNFLCEICNRVYKFEARLKRHIKTHETNEINEKGLFECDVCKKEFKLKWKCSDHKKIHFNIKPHKCTQCVKQFRNISNLNMHFQRMHQSFDCSQCLKSFKSKSQLKIHIRDHSDVRSNLIQLADISKVKNTSVTCAETQVPLYKCQICTHEYKSIIVLNKHLRLHENNEINKKGLYECEICNKQFIFKLKLLEHKNIHLNIRPHKCTQCEKTFLSTDNLNSHIKRMHETICSFFCNQCSKSFKSNSELTSHLKVHSHERPFKCYDCSKCFKAKGEVSKHIKRVHLVVRPVYQCKVCDEIFKHEYHLTCHAQVHSDLRLFVCNYKQCGRKFKSKRDLTSHRTRTHKVSNIFVGTNKKAWTRDFGRKFDDCAVATVAVYLCQICDREFKFQESVNKHLKLHQNNEINDKGLYECEICKKEFNIKSTYLDHKKVHNVSKCSLCRMQFNDIESLSAHIKLVHETPSLHSCLLCSTCFKSRRNVTNHVKVDGDDRLFKCEECSISFKSGFYLSVVRKRKIRIKATFQCKDCGKKFKTKKTLQSHMKVHVDSNFICRVCGQVYKSRSKLAAHSIRHKTI